MKKNNKALLVTLSAVVLVIATVFGTMAYFTDQEAVINTFTVGKVDITLDEKNVDGKDAEGKDNSGEDRDVSNKYHLVPGQTYIKDPTIHVDADSEDCYLFVKVKNNIKDIETKDTAKTIAEQMKNLGWKTVDGVENLYVFAPKKDIDKYAISKGGNVVVFKNFTIDGATVDNNNIAEYETAKHGTMIEVTAYAVQKAGFENSTPEQIWAATFGK